MTDGPTEGFLALRPKFYAFAPPVPAISVAEHERRVRVWQGQQEAAHTEIVSDLETEITRLREQLLEAQEVICALSRSTLEQQPTIITASEETGWGIVVDDRLTAVYRAALAAVAEAAAKP